MNDEDRRGSKKGKISKSGETRPKKGWRNLKWSRRNAVAEWNGIVVG